MADAETRKEVTKIPRLKVKAGPRDGELWRERLKEEYTALIAVCIIYPLLLFSSRDCEKYVRC